MATTSDDRRAELMAAALADDLSSAERLEFERMAEADPAVRHELAEMSALTDSLTRGVPDWLEGEPLPSLRDRVAGLAAGGGEQPVEAASHPAMDVTAHPTANRRPRSVSRSRPRATAPRTRRRLQLMLGGAACVVAGAAIAAAVNGIATAPPSGPPGTLGAVEEVDFRAEPPEVRIEGSLVAHTWGTETVMEIDGLPAEELYSLVLLAENGTEFDSGTFFGSDVRIECRMNAAVMRQDVVRVEIRDADGEVVSAADLPQAVDA
ncbi:hypothetical protein [Citricoccus sp.]|uniref:hypothetical protein n=1 Tax=Citricoccus sp. TaxID=1978372 RepID=UPI0028BE23A8|nr:hypothetical protein [Citricoccus sp.]